MRLSKTKKLVLSAICLSLCIVLPTLFHAVPDGGSIFLPMHLPVLLCGLLSGTVYGTVCGLLGPLLSSLITGMPPLSSAPSMMIECAVYGLVCGIMIRFIHTKKPLLDLYLSLFTSMLAGRVVAGFVSSLIFSSGASPFAWAGASLITGLPGILIQLVLIPLLIVGLEGAKLLPKRY